jgi:hypothetical protein
MSVEEDVRTGGPDLRCVCASTPPNPHPPHPISLHDMRLRIASINMARKHLAISCALRQRVLASRLIS